MDTKKKYISISSLLSTLKEVILFGAGGAGRDALSVLQDKEIKVLFICDNDTAKHGDTLQGIKICPPEILQGHQDKVVLIASDYAKEIALQLQDLEVMQYYYFGYCFDFERWADHFEPQRITEVQEKIDLVRSLFRDDESRQLFDAMVQFRFTSDPTFLNVSNFQEYLHPLVRPSSGDTLIDAGAWIGDTALLFAKEIHSDGKIYSFEPDSNNFQQLLKNIKTHNLVQIVKPINKGLWKESTVLNFNDSIPNSMQYRVDPKGKRGINVTSIDAFATKENINIDLIKMDIEGAEFSAVQGARNTLHRDAPKLQICIYHNFDDLWEIPLLIKHINPRYKLFLGIHKQHFIDTILYAVI